MSLKLETISPVANSPLVAASQARDMRLRALAREVEAGFLSEMLKSAGLGAAHPAIGGGGAGEEQFGSFLRAEQARQMVEAGGLGLAEHIFEALKARADGHG